MESKLSTLDIPMVTAITSNALNAAMKQYLFY